MDNDVKFAKFSIIVTYLATGLSCYRMLINRLLKSAYFSLELWVINLLLEKNKSNLHYFTQHYSGSMMSTCVIKRLD